MAIAADRGKSIFRKTDKELVRLSSGCRAEAVHGFRTSARRLQTLLGQLVANGSRPHKKLLKMLNRIRKSAGKVRDIDVQLEALRSLRIPQEPRRKTQLTQSLLDLRAGHEKKLSKLLKKDDVREIRKRLRRAQSAVKFETGPDPLAVARQMIESVTNPGGPADEGALHRYRIIVKRARYAAEFAPRSEESTVFLAELKRLQDALGNWHDWLTLTRSAVDRLGDVHQSPLVAALYNVTRGKYRNAVAAVSSAKSKPRIKRNPAVLKTISVPAVKSTRVPRRTTAAA